MLLAATKIDLAPPDRAILEARVRSRRTEHRDRQRAEIVLGAADGKATRAIARDLKVTPFMVSQWRGRFARGGMKALDDKPRSGAPPKYDANMTSVFSQLSIRRFQWVSRAGTAHCWPSTSLT